ncbi:HAD family hydrolase [Sinorhizobium sp. A49]|uniref:D-glycero-alpha-D-manno-heptose-1,7-bisphosphate 7-phosphatase n=1 Tax=Sinorhizobium sp. A49 TaxID=1945861 RepID=UPI0009846CA8|nr:HAD family hydrolase [Sinorhizobium sp. A49]OOG63082.1 HAD family hydrolase [Sinorhizobium sp. A49]
MTKTIFLDRDGTVIVDKDYLSSPLQVELEVGAAEGLSLLVAAGYRLIGVTNQSGVGRGYFTMGDVDACNRRVDELLAEHGVSLGGWFVCPHAPNEACACRKPRPGLLDQAMSVQKVDLGESYVIGDKDSDVLLGESRGMRGVLVLSGSGRKHADWAQSSGRVIARNLLEAARGIVAGRI